MSTLTRTLVIIGAGAALLTVSLGAVWLARHQPASFYTDADSIRVPAGGAPLRSILWQPARAVEGDINTSADEYEPRLSADGTVMVLVRGKPGADANLLESRWTPEGWTAPVAIAAVNTAADELGPELSRDGDTLYFYSDRDGGLGGYDIWWAQRESDGWSAPVNLGPGVNSPANEYGPALDATNTTLFFASNRPRPGETVPERDPWPATVRETRDRHDYDLYRATITEAGDTASDAAPITELNTLADEGAPAFSPAGDFLYFASDRAGGLGGFDIYRARHRAPAFDPPTNIGDAVNSVGNDLDPALSMEGFRLHFSSNRATTAEPGDYGVWVSHSREVYLEHEPARASLADFLGFLVPWLLLLLLALLLALLLVRLWRTPSLRGKFGRLSLLAQCLLVSLALHILIASLLAIWRVGNELSQLLNQQGGTRVILASAGDADAFSAQLLAAITSEQQPSSVPALAEASLTPGEIDVAPERTTAAATDSPEVPLAVDAPAPRDDAARPSELIPNLEPTRREADLVAATPGPVAPSDPVSEQAAQLPRTVNSDAAPAPSSTLSTTRSLVSPAATTVVDRETPVVPAPVTEARPAPSGVPLADAVPRLENSTAVSTAAPPTTAAPAPSQEAQPESAPATAMAAPSLNVRLAVVTAVVNPPAGVSLERAGEIVIDQSGDRGTTAGTSPAPPPEGTARLLGPAPSVAATAPTVPPAAPAGAPGEPVLLASPQVASAAPPANAPSVVAVRVEAGVAPLRLREDAAPLTLSAPTTPVHAGTSSPAAASSVLSPTAGSLVRAATPRADASEQSTGTPEVANGPSPKVTTPTPSPAVAVGSPSSAAHTVRLPAPPSSSRDDARPGVATHPASRSSSAPASSPAASLPAPALASAGVRSTLPVAEEPPAPKETFAQRAPEVRTEMLEKMGGSPETERAVGLALDWFARHQRPDGRWSGHAFDEGCGRCNGAAEVECDAAMTGLALLCYLGAGHTPDKEGPYRANVSSAMEYLLSRQDASGDLRRGETMYSQSIATVALCEAYAMTRDARLGAAARRAVEFMCEGVKRAASRRQDDRSRADDTSVLGWQVMAMESARRSGFTVPETTFRSADAFLDKVAARRSPGRYAHRPGGEANAAMTAEAMFVRQLMGADRGQANMRDSAAFILETPPRWKDGAFTYYWYYATLALFQHQGEAWEKWNAALVPELIANQRSDAGASGSWDPQDEYSKLGGRVYQTAVCTLSLEVYYRYKPAGTPAAPAGAVSPRATGR